MPGSTNYSLNPALWDENNSSIQDTNTTQKSVKYTPRPMTQWEKSLVKSMEMPITKITPVQKKPTWVATNANINKGNDSYTVKAGNTLGQIVADYNKKNNTNLKWQDVAKWNNIDPTKMKIGQVISFTNPATSQTTSTEIKSNTTAAPTVAIKAPATNSERVDSVMVQPTPNINSSDSLRVDSVSRDSALVLPVDTVRADSALLSSPDSVFVSSGTPVSVTRSPKNFIWSGQYFNYPTEQFMQEMNYWRNYFNSKSSSKKNVSSNKQGGTMNRINYFQQGGAAPSAQQGQADAFMQAILQGDPQAIAQLVEVANSGNGEAQQLIQTILQEEQKGNNNVAKAAQVIKQILGQATSAKWGSKLQYIRSLKYAKGGKTCPACEQKVEMKKCGGKKAKKRYFGGYL